MCIALAVLFAFHGIAHGVGFAVPSRLAEFEDVPHGTTLLAGRLCVLGWPEARIGVAVNVVILAFLVLGGRYGWLPGA